MWANTNNSVYAHNAAVVQCEMIIFMNTFCTVGSVRSALFPLFRVACHYLTKFKAARHVVGFYCFFLFQPTATGDILRDLQKMITVRVETVYPSN